MSRGKYWQIQNHLEKTITKSISHNLKFINSTRFMASLLSNLVDNLAEGIRKTKCKNGHDNKKC